MSARDTKKPTSKHEGPSAESLEAIPPLDRDTGISFGRGPEGLRRLRQFRKLMQTNAGGRPKKGEQAQGSSGRSVRLPDSVWVAVDSLAAKRGIPSHAFLREAIVRYVLAQSPEELPIFEGPEAMDDVADVTAKTKAGRAPAKSARSSGRSGRSRQAG